MNFIQWKTPAAAERPRGDPLQPAPRAPHSNARPIFVLGSVRSGTSAVVQALRQGAGIRGHSEGNVAALMRHLLDQVDEFFRNFSPDYLAATDHHLIGHLDPEALRVHITNYFSDVYARHLGDGEWVDKSPDSYLHAPMIRAVPQLLRMFPSARFIFCARRGIENVMSRMKKFPEVPFGYQCRSWAHTFEHWGEVRDSIPENQRIEVYQRDIAIAPQKVAQALRTFLGLTDQQAEGVLGMFSGRRVEQTQSAREHSEMSLEETPWDEGYRAAFVRWCEPMMRVAGFDLIGRQYAVDAPVVLFHTTDAAAVHLENIHPEWGFEDVEGALQLHPNDGSQPEARVRYLRVPLDGQNEWSAQVAIHHPEGPEVILGLRILAPDDQSVVAESSIRMQAQDGTKLWGHRFPALQGAFDIELTSRLADPQGRAEWAWARLRHPQLRRGASGP